MLALTDNILRIVNFCFLVILLGLVGSLLATQSAGSSRVNYCMFTAAFAMVTDSFYGLFANFLEPLAWPIILFVLDFLNFAFTFTAGTVLAVAIRTHSCTNTDYLDSNGVAQGSTQRCRESQAATAFFYFTFFVFLAKMILSGLSLMTNGPFSATGGFSARRRKTAQVGVPTISQV